MWTKAPSVPLERGTHACWVVDGATDYIAEARRILADGETQSQSTVVFGPRGGEALVALASSARMAADPAEAFLGNGPLSPARMIQMFAAQTKAARAQGFDGVRVVADMDWLLSARPTTDEIVGFELQLDRVVKELGATVVCAYRRGSFDAETILANACIHPRALGDDDPPFRFVAGHDGGWVLSGEVDVAGAEALARAVRIGLCEDPCVVDARGLRFIDVSGMRAIAEAATASRARLVVRGAPSIAQRAWALAGFDAAAPSVEFAA